jgi:hypothetical protein
MGAERKPEPAPPQRRASFGTTPGSRNRGFDSSDPERQRETADPTDGAARNDDSQDAHGARGARRPARTDGQDGSG